MHHIHLVSGLPRSGSTLLASILRQNPAFHAAISSPVAEICGTLLLAMSTGESRSFISDEQREAIVRGVFVGYYNQVDGARRVIFDTNRHWCALLSMVTRILGKARIICCVRSPAWIIDSFERLAQRNCLRISPLFDLQPLGNVYSRADHLFTTGCVGSSLNALRQAWFSELHKLLIVVRYDSLVRRPQEVFERIYQEIGEPAFVHDFENIWFESESFDEGLQVPGLHTVRGPVRVNQRRTILPPDLFAKYDKCFWNHPEENRNGVLVL